MEPLVSKTNMTSVCGAVMASAGRAQAIVQAAMITAVAAAATKRKH